MLGSTSVILFSSWSIKFFYNNKNIAKLFEFRSEVLYWLYTWGKLWCNNTNSVNPKNTDNFTFMKQSFCDTGTLRKRKLPLHVPITLPDIYIKMEKLAEGTCGRRSSSVRQSVNIESSTLLVGTVTVIMSVFMSLRNNFVKL